MNLQANSQITVLHILSSADIAGGERYLLDLINNSDNSINHLIVLPYPGPFLDLLISKNHNFTIVNMTRRFSLTSIPQLIRHIKSTSADILHTHGYRANFYGRIAGLLSNYKIVSTVHVSLYDYIDTHFLIRWLYISIEKLLSWKTNKFICISQAMLDDMLKIGIDKSKIELIPNGVDLRRFFPKPVNEELKSKLGIAPNSPVIGTVGRMVPEKGQKYLIEAISLLKPKWNNLKCLFVGDGPLLSELKKQANDLDISDMCVFTGTRNDIELVYPVLDLFVLPSLREPFGLVLLEAMACEKPVVTTDSGGPSEFIKSGINGILVPPRDSKALALQINRLLSEKEKAGDIGKEGLKTVRNFFSVKQTARKIGDIYFSICSS